MSLPTYQGIVGGFAIRVRITGYKGRPNTYIPPGTVGLLVPCEQGVFGDISQATFYPQKPDGSYDGYGLVQSPTFESV